MSRTFTIANDERLIAMVASARRRLVIVSPGLWKPVAEAVVARIHSPDCPAQLSLILDVDPEVCRLGFGDVESIDLLNAALKEKGSQLQRQDGVRIGLIISDEEILIYSPTPKLIEAGSDAVEKPNAIQLSQDAGAALARACGAGDRDDSKRPDQGVDGDDSTGSDQDVDRVGSDTNEQHAEQEIGLDFVDTKRVEEVKLDLKANPPKQFNLARIERVFNYKLEFVEFAVEHYKLGSRAVPLKPDLLGLADKNLRDRFRNTFRVFGAGAPFSFELGIVESKEVITLSESWLTDRAHEIRKTYFIPLGASAYGSLIQKRLKLDFIAEVEALARLVDLYAELVRGAIDAEIENTRSDLIEALLPRVQAAPPKRWLNRSVSGTLTDNTLRERLEEEVEDAFGKFNESFKPKVTFLFKGVTYGTITFDDEFRKRMVDYFGKEDAAKLFEEYDASRGTVHGSSKDDDPDDPAPPTQPELF